MRSRDIYTSTAILSPWSRVLPEKLTPPQLVKKFPAFYGTRRFMTAFTTARHMSLYWTRSIQSARPSYFPTIHFNIILHLRLGLPNCLLPSGFPTKTLYAPLLSPFVLLALPISVFLTSSPEWYLVWSTEHKAPCYVVFSTPLFPRPLVSNTLLSTLFSNNLSQCSFLNVSDQVSHPHKTTGTITTRYRFTRNEGFYGGSVSPVCLSVCL